MEHRRGSRRPLRVPTTPIADKISIAFDGVDELLNGGDSVHTMAKTTARSTSMWVKSSNTGATMELMGKFMSGGAFRGWTTYIGNTSIVGFRIREDAGDELRKDMDSSNFVNGSWQHLAVTYGGTVTTASIDIYVNGVVLTSVNFSQNNLTGSGSEATAEFCIGARRSGGGPTGAPFNGRIEYAAVWNGTKLTAAQVLALYNGGVRKDPREVLTPTSFWPFTKDDTSTLVTDAMGYANLTPANMDATNFVEDTPPR